MWIICMCFLFNCQVFVYSPIIFLLIPRLIFYGQRRYFLWFQFFCVCQGVFYDPGYVLSWWMSYDYLKRRLLLLLVFCECKPDPAGWWCCSVLLNPCWSVVNIFLKEKNQSGFQVIPITVFCWSGHSAPLWVCLWRVSYVVLWCGRAVSEKDRLRRAGTHWWQHKTEWGTKNLPWDHGKGVINSGMNCIHKGKATEVKHKWNPHLTLNSK